MKLTKTLAALCVLGAGLLAFTACKDSSGDIDTSGGKWALTMTIDSTGDEIKVGKKAITDSNEGTETEILENTDEGKTTVVGHEAEQQQCGKRAFKEISGGFNNNCGFRTNVVLDTTSGTWYNSVTDRKANAGILFDFYKYDNKFDFFYISFVPQFSGSSVTGVTCYFERYSGVKKYNAGIYTRHAAASCLGKNYVPTDSSGTWNSTLYNPEDGISWSKSLASGSDYRVEDGQIIIGVNVKQFTPGLYSVQIGKISYTLGDAAQTFSPAAFNKAWKTNFAVHTQMGVGGQTSTASTISGYGNWTHIDNDNKDTNLIGGVMVYGFAPYGTKPVATFFTCSTSAKKDYKDNADSQVDYVGDWNVANELDTGDGLKTSVVYEEGGVVHEYVEY